MKEKNFWQEQKSPLQQESPLQNEENELTGYGQAEQNGPRGLFRQEQFQADLLHITQSVQGRRFLRQLLLMTGVFEEIPIGNAAYYAYLEGRRSLGLMLYHRLYALGINYLAQIQEQK